jgi:hypothetical protein
MRTRKYPRARLVIQLILLGLVRLALVAQLLGASAITGSICQLSYLYEHQYTTKRSEKSLGEGAVRGGKRTCRHFDYRQSIYRHQFSHRGC